MKKTLAFLVCLALLVSSLAFAGAEGSPLEFNWLTTEDAQGFWSADDVTIVELQNQTNTKINFEEVNGETYDTSLQTMLASGNLPDVVTFKSSNQVNMMVDQGALLPLDDLLEQYGQNILKVIGEENFNSARAADGHIYIVPAKYQTPLTQSWIIRTDWLERCGLSVPTTWDEFVKVLEAFKAQDANGDGDASNEIPLSGMVEKSLYTFGIYNNDIFCVNQAGDYTLIYEHENYRAWLEAMRDLFARGLLDPEYLDRDGFGEDEQRLIAAMANNLVGAAYTFMNNMHNADDLDGQYEYLIPVVGPFGDQHVPGRGVGITYPAAAIMANAEDKAVELIKMLDWIFSEDGQRLFSFGVEGVTYDMVDGKPVLKPEYTTSFVDYRSAGMNYQLIPHVWLSDAYVHVFTNGKTVEEMDHVAQQFVYGAEQNEIYAMNFPAVLSTDAYMEYYADLGEQVKSLQANAIAGNITVDEFFAQYEQLKAQGLQEVIDQGAAAYEAMNK